MAIPLGRLDINAVDGKKTSAPGAASVAHIIEADIDSQAATTKLVIKNMFQFLIGSLLGANDGVEVLKLNIYQPTIVIVASSFQGC